MIIIVVPIVVNRGQLWVLHPAPPAVRRVVEPTFRVALGWPLLCSVLLRVLYSSVQTFTRPFNGQSNTIRNLNYTFFGVSQDAPH